MAGAKFSKPAEDLYPGIRSPLPTEYQQVASNTAALALDWPQDELQEPLFAAFSMTTQAPSTLAPIQSIPHFDDTDSGKYAMVHYLFDAPLGGTAFFRHRKTGLEQITQDTVQSYMQQLKRQASTEGLPSANYIQGSTPLFEEVCRVEAKFNRTILYPCNLLHSGLIDPSASLSDDPKQGRLTANMALRISSSLS